MNSINNDKRTLLLKTGKDIFAAHGFTNVGLAELLKKADIPKGSFYYYFNSKEEYGVEVIRYYMNEYTAKMTQLFNDNTLSVKDRLLTYWKKWETTQSCNQFQGQCLIVKLSSEVSDLSDAMRHEFCIGTGKVLELIISIIKDGQQDDSISKQLNPTICAQELYQQWLGASLLTKIQKNDCSFKTAMAFTKKLLTIE